MTGKKIAVLISGGGTDFQSIIDGVESGYIQNAKICCCISNKEDAFGLERAKKHGIDAIFVDHRKKKREELS